MSTLNLAPDFREACEGWHFHTQQHLVTTHDVPSSWLLTSLSVCARMLNALWQIWRGTYSVTKRSKPFLRKCPTIMRYILYVPLLPLICSQRFSLSLSLTYTNTKLGVSINSMSFTFSLSAVYAKAEFCSHTLNAILLSSWMRPKQICPCKMETWANYNSENGEKETVNARAIICYIPL